MAKRKGNKKPYAKAPARTPQAGKPGEPAARAATMSAEQTAAGANPAPSESPRSEAQGAARQQTLDQMRAKHAWDTVEEVKDSPKVKDFVGHAKKLPMRIRAAGLGQALAFVASKGTLGDPKDDKYNKSLETLMLRLNDWVLDQRGLRGESKAEDPEAMLREITARDAAFLKRATMETMGWLQWVNRFAEAKGLKGDDDSE